MFQHHDLTGLGDWWRRKIWYPLPFANDPRQDTVTKEGDHIRVPWRQPHNEEAPVYLDIWIEDDKCIVRATFVGDDPDEIELNLGLSKGYIGYPYDEDGERGDDKKTNPEYDTDPNGNPTVTFEISTDGNRVDIESNSGVGDSGVQIDWTDPDENNPRKVTVTLTGDLARTHELTENDKDRRR